MSASAPNPSPASVLFARGVLARLRAWPALSLAINQSWGGPESPAKFPWLAGVLVDSFEDPPAEGIPDAEYVEAMLLQIMEDEFDCTLEDESAWDAARDVVKVWDTLTRNMDDAKKMIETMEVKAEKVKGKKIEAQREGPDTDEEDWSGDEDEEMTEDDAPQLLVVEHPPDNQRPDPIVDEEGFTMVQGKGKRKS